jgi:hypothetical protein
VISAILHSPVPLNSDSTSYGKSSEGLAAAFLVPRALEGLALRNLYPNEPLSTRCLGAQRYEGSDQIYVYEWADPFWHAACAVLRQLVTGTSYAGHELDDPRPCLGRFSGDARHGRSVNDRREFRQLPVVDDGNLMSIVTDGELRRRGCYLESTPVLAAMTNCPVVLASF